MGTTLMKYFSKYLLLTAALLVTLPFVAQAQTALRPAWSVWVKQLRTEAILDGIRPELFDRVFKNLRPRQAVLRLDRKQPEKRLTFLKYRRTRATSYRIQLGVKKYKRQKFLLNKIGQQYGVSPCFILALWGMESSYGHYLGHFPVIQSLATLAYDKRRSKFFRKELLHALHILNEGHVNPSKFKGEWAGASGHPQFLPSSWRHYAVDHNRDGLKDIWNTYADVFASIANYLVKNGWQSDKPWGVEVTAPKNLNPKLINYRATKTVAEWRQLGIHARTSKPLPNDQLNASLIRPYGGPYFLIFKNFKVIMRWNRSNYYAATIGYMADQLCKKI